MGKMKKLSKLTAGILSFALAMGAVGNIPPLMSSNKAAAAEEYYENEAYEVEVKDAYIYYKIIPDEHFSSSDPKDIYYLAFDILPQRNGYVDYYDRITIRLRSPIDRGISPNDEENKEYYDLWARTCNNYDLFDEEDIVTLKFTTYDKDEADALQAELDKEGGYWGSSSSDKKVFGMDFLSSVRSLGIHYYGDINDDGVVDSFDSVTYRKQIAGTLTDKLSEAQFLNGDINKDDKIDEEDLKAVQDYLLGRTKEFNGVSDIGSIRLDNTVDVQASEGKATDAEFASAEMKFGVDILKKCFEPTNPDEKNLLISPLSISAALAMTANGADGETKTEMEKVLGNGLTMDQLNEYMAYYISKLPNEKKQKVLVADSIWFKDKPSFKVYDSFLEQNKKYYNAQLYKAAFDDSTVKDVNSWVNENTQGMIPSILKKGDLTPTDQKEILMMLINTLYFEAEWSSPYTNSVDGKFTDLNGEEHPIKKMFSREYQYFDLGDADAFKKSYAGGNYSFVGIMPKEKDIVEYVNDLDAEKLFEGLKEYEDPETIELNVMIPKFKYNYSKSLKKVLSEIGMPTAFSMEKADFSKINDLSVENADPLYIDDVAHKTRIEVTEKGTKAAAVTAVMMAAGSAMPIEKKKVNIYLDKPFVYMIVDKNNVPLFIGAATEIEEQ
ncbi:serpin family protein [Ruminococcus flavefaciens]|uniref:serpin family protein n=1 Tax=Ruminococcus flavefaciens TaxID=1265 RepID=UPI0004658519|nr:serpin family protein [Ruminococcus flavefaciens]